MWRGGMYVVVAGVLTFGALAGVEKIEQAWRRWRR